MLRKFHKTFYIEKDDQEKYYKKVMCQRDSLAIFESSHIDVYHVSGCTVVNSKDCGTTLVHAGSTKKANLDDLIKKCEEEKIKFW